MSIFGKASRIRHVIAESGVATLDTIYIGNQGTDAGAARKAGAALGAVQWRHATIEALRQHRPAVEFENPAALATLGPPNPEPN